MDNRGYSEEREREQKRFTASPMKTNSGTTGYGRWGQETGKVQQQAIHPQWAIMVYKAGIYLNAAW